MALYAITTMTLMVHPVPGSQLLWLGFMVSGVAFVIGMYRGFKDRKRSLGLLLASVLLGLAVVFVGDVLVGVALSCASGDCL